MKKYYYTALALVLPLATAPTSTFAQIEVDPDGTAGYDPADVEGFLGNILDWVNLIIPIVIGVGFIIFLFAVIKFILAAGDEEARKDSRQLMLYAIIGVFVMVAIWGIIALIAGSFGIGVGGEATAPVINLESGNSN